MHGRKASVAAPWVYFCVFVRVPWRIDGTRQLPTLRPHWNVYYATTTATHLPYTKYYLSICSTIRVLVAIDPTARCMADDVGLSRLMTRSLESTLRDGRAWPSFTKITAPCRRMYERAQRITYLNVSYIGYTVYRIYSYVVRVHAQASTRLYVNIYLRPMKNGSTDSDVQALGSSDQR